MNASAGAGGGGAGGGGAGGGGALFSAEDLACPICVETIEDAFATPCGHTFCFKCISTHLKNKSTCPSCAAHLVQDQIHPNFLLNKLIQRAATVQQAQSLKTVLLQHVQHDLAAAGPSIGLQELDAAIQLLQDKRQQVATHESSNKLQLLMLFLQHAKSRQLGQLSDLEQQLDVLQQDLAKARAAAGAAAAAPNAAPPDGQQQQHAQGGAAAVAPAAPVTQAVAGAPNSSSSQAAPGASHLGGPGSAFKRLQPVVASQPPPQQHLQQQQQMPKEPQQVQPPPPQQQQQQQQGFRPLPKPQQQQPVPQQGFRPLPKPQQQQQPLLQQQQQPQIAQQGALQQPSQASEKQLQPPPPQQLQQQQQQQQLAYGIPQQGFRPLPKPQQQAPQQEAPVPPITQRGFRPFAPQPQAAAAVAAMQNPSQAGQPQGLSGVQGFRPYTQQPGLGAGSQHLSPAADGQEGLQGSQPKPAAAAVAAPAGGSAVQAAAAPAPTAAAAGDAAAAGAQQRQQQQPQQVGFRPLQAPQQQPQPQQQQQQQQQQLQQQPQQQQQEGFRRFPADQGIAEATLNPEKKRKILAQFDELQQAYLTSRMRRSAAAGAEQPGDQQQQQGDGAGPGQARAVSSRLKTHPQQPAAAAGGAGGAEAAGNAAHQQPGSSSAVQAAAPAEGTQASAAGAAAGGGGEEVLDAFSRMLYAVTHYSRLQPLACIPPAGSSSTTAGATNAGGASAAQILSSVDFDCAGELFATAGVQQRIFVHSFQSVLTHGGPTHPPQQQQQQAALAACNDAAAAAAAAAGGGGGGLEGAAGAGGSSGSDLSPVLDLPTGSKISCVCFSPAVQQYLLSSDYAGGVQLWDLTGGRTVRQWEAHDKRIWAVDFCPLEATTFATGSDDGTVKVWGLCEPPVPRMTLPVRANVCSIKFSPAAPNLLAAGNAGHQVHLFDLRFPRAPLAVLKGHSKAVSYVRWAGPDALVTASTDSTLRLWTATGGRGSSDSGAGGNKQQQQQHATGAAAAGGAAGGGGSGWDAEEGGWHCSQVFRGHVNTKHFVGLATQGPFIACGSETNEVLIYHQGLAQPSLKCSLKPWDAAAGASSSGGLQDGVSAAGAGAAAGEGGSAAGVKSPFVSALCWKKDSDVLVAANSKGGVWVLGMQ